MGAPVDDAASLVDQALVIQLAEGLPHGLGAALIHGEAGAAPVAGDAHLLLLLHDAVAILLLPLPHPLEELLPAQIIAGQALLDAQFLLHLDLSGDAGMVGAGDPQRGVALHPLEAGQDVLQCAVQGVAHVELARDVGWRHDDGEGLLLGIRIPVKAVVVLPHLVDTGLHLLGFIHLGQFFHHTFDLSYSLNFRPFCHDWGAGPHRPAVHQIAAQLQRNALCALTQQKRPGPFGSGRTNVRGTTWIRENPHSAAHLRLPCQRWASAGAY